MPLHTAPRDERPAIGFGLLGYGFMGRAHSHSLHSIGHMYWPGAARPELVAVAGHPLWVLLVHDGLARHDFRPGGGRF